MFFSIPIMDNTEWRITVKLYRKSGFSVLPNHLKLLKDICDFMRSFRIIVWRALDIGNYSFKFKTVVFFRESVIDRIEQCDETVCSLIVRRHFTLGVLFLW